jgi:uncharacterized protein with GYD domain
MPKYLMHGSYTGEGIKGLAKDGGTGRRQAAEAAIKGLGGSLEAFYFAFGQDDLYLILDMPDAESAAALSLAINGAGAFQVQTVPLISPEEMDRATKKTVTYRPPGR